MDPNDKHLMAFTIPGVGQFQWIGTPQGLMGAPVSFSRLIDLIMEGAANVITYIDDVLIHSLNHSEHMVHLEEAIKRIQRVHLRLNAKKCIFTATSVQYLGHTLSSEGVTPGNSKIEAIQKLMLPKNTKQLKSFLGLANYFRLYINCLLYTSPSPRDRG